ncbi:lipopolysaccharide heptosyltransferase I [Methylotenera sp.]|uniref:lipopolysaccharide heptosyltransferase I n=1 Tax=Methylotenera sp. TaxID=2051956 RepID=UPI002486FB97|nr:lipopolysaccharide heptosyltransferase I [Methylotenera sp.]MDI1297878.1 lipopolysaccharide heptosyltransferase I [Methylotenera sp.]
MNILIVKLSSLGDVLHNLPIVWDLRRQYPDANIDWVVEEGYVSLIEPLRTGTEFKGIDRIIPLGFRRWKKSLFNKKTRSEISAFRRELRLVSYDLVIETQGLIKSAVVSRLARRNLGGSITGLGNATEGSGYEPMARWFYTRCVQVPKQCHAVERSRLVAAEAINSSTTLGIPQFYPQVFVDTLAKKNQEISADFNGPYILFFHATARTAKTWNEDNWIKTGQHLARIGCRVILPWGNLAEKTVSERLCQQIPNAVVPKAFNLTQAFSIVAGAEMVIGVDTGLTHLSAIMCKPTIELYCDSPRWKTEGFWSEKIKNLGDIAQPPSVQQVLTAIQQILPQYQS